MTQSATATLMVQGTSSNAGKSVLVTAICRVLARHGVKVAPFKPQNMALNSAVTADGKEIGRAQAVQAAACFLEPAVMMNPVLLKPNSEVGAQVIVNGEAIGNMRASEYHAFKPTLKSAVLAAYQQLAAAHTAVIVEGAGSPAEINLRAHDIANMGFAEAIACPVVIVADIDRGGVFAHLYGTWALLAEHEQALVKGFVINRFRGDVSLLHSGLDWLERKTGVPVLAVLPYLPDLHIEAEDSLGLAQPAARGPACALKVTLLRYPRICNHTDFDALCMHAQVACRFEHDSRRFQGADLLILPGSKHVRADLQWLQEQGWASHIQRHLRHGGKLLGICGGYQMLGHCIHDPEGVESAPGSTAALGLVDMETTLAPKKTLRKVSGRLLEGGLPVAGYEIHAGLSDGSALDNPLCELRTGPAATPFPDGVLSADNSIAGTYLHGLFDTPEALGYFLGWAGLEAVETFDYPAYREQQIDRIADALEAELPLASLRALLGMNP